MNDISMKLLPWHWSSRKIVIKEDSTVGFVLSIKDTVEVQLAMKCE